MAWSLVFTGNLLLYFTTEKCIRFPGEDYHHVSKQIRMYLLVSYSKMDSQCFLWLSQPCMTSSPKPEAVAHFIWLCMWNIPWLFHTQPWPVRVQLFETIYGTEWAGLWSNNPSLAIFIITSYKAAYICLPDAKYRHSLSHTPTGTKLGPD